MTAKRVARISEVVRKRQKYLTVVLENIHDPHNVSAILRSADAVGIDRVYLIYNSNKYPRISRVSSASAKKWIEAVRFDNVRDCFNTLRQEKFKIYSTFMKEGGNDYSLYELDLTDRTALVFGNEHDGVSEDVKNLSDKNFLIPMYGMVQSLNVSVAVAVCLFESLRQRSAKKMYERSQYKKVELNKKLEDYLNK